MWRIEFSSADFVPRLPEAAQANPGVYGFELAWWLAQALARRSVATSYPISEDWGWLLEHIDGEQETTIGCASLSDPDEGYTGQALDWSVFVRPHVSLKRKWFGKAASVTAPAVLTEAITASLREQGISWRQVES